MGFPDGEILIQWLLANRLRLEVIGAHSSRSAISGPTTYSGGDEPQG